MTITHPPVAVGQFILLYAPQAPHATTKPPIRTISVCPPVVDRQHAPHACIYTSKARNTLPHIKIIKKQSWVEDARPPMIIAEQAAHPIVTNHASFNLSNACSKKYSTRLEKRVFGV